jgi:hypothetical protein
MSKRKFDEVDVNELTLKPEVISTKLLNTIKSWTDSCGSLYSIEHELVKERDSAVLKVGFFDELECKKLVTLCASDLPGNFDIETYTCNMKKSSVSIKIIKLVQNKRTAISGPLPGGTAAGATLPEDPNEKMKLRIMYDIRESDIDAVYTAIHKTKQTAVHGKDIHLLKITNRPKHYSLHFNVTADTLPRQLIDVAAHHEGNIDFENKQIHMQISKTVSEIE